MSKITITINYRSNKYTLQFQDDLTIDTLMKELHRIPILLDFTPQTMADWQGELLPVFDAQAYDDMLCREMDLEEQVDSLQEKLDRITADNLFEEFAPLARVDSAVTINRNRLQEALDKCLGYLKGE